MDPEGGTLTFPPRDCPRPVDPPATGEISGTATTTGTFIPTVTVMDPSGDDDSESFVWNRRRATRGSCPPRRRRFPTAVAVDFVAQTTTTGIFEYEWSFGDGSPTVGPLGVPNVTHTFPGPGRYLVTLTVTDTEFPQQDVHQFTQVITGAPSPVPRARVELDRVRVRRRPGLGR